MDQVLSVHLEPPNQSTLRTKSRFSNFIIFKKHLAPTQFFQKRL